jgi:hypothetical protein
MSEWRQFHRCVTSCQHLSCNFAEFNSHRVSVTATGDIIAPGFENWRKIPSTNGFSCRLVIRLDVRWCSLQQHPNAVRVILNINLLSIPGVHKSLVPYRQRD